MTKEPLRQAIVAHFEKEWEVTMGAAKHIYEAATHEDARAENKYDTRGLEASYLAESQARRAQSLRQTIGVFQKMDMPDFPEQGPVDTGALISLEDGNGKQKHCFLSPRGGGTKIQFDNRVITLITPASPLGKQLQGAELGDEVTIGEDQAGQAWEITAIS